MRQEAGCQQDDPAGPIPRPSEGWDQATTSALWRFLAEQRPQLYFSNVHAQALHRVLAHAGLGAGDRILDVGCGPGFLLRHLLDQGYDAHGVDLSADAIRVAMERNRVPADRVHLGELQGVQAGLGAFRFATLIETVEHMPEDRLGDLLDGIWSSLVPGGRLVITAPLREVLEDNTVYCPFCHSLFHPVQHQRRIDPDELAGFLGRHRFRPIFSAGIDLEGIGDPIAHPGIGWSRTPRLMRMRVRLAAWMDRRLGTAFPDSRHWRLVARPGSNLLAVADRIG